MGAEGELFLQIWDHVDAEAGLLRNREIAVLHLGDVIDHIALAQLHAAAGQMVGGGGSKGIRVLRDGDVVGCCDKLQNGGDV